MKRTRKIFALLLSICMIVTMLPTVAFAAIEEDTFLPISVSADGTITVEPSTASDSGEYKYGLAKTDPTETIKGWTVDSTTAESAKTVLDSGHQQWDSLKKLTYNDIKEKPYLVVINEKSSNVHAVGVHKVTEIKSDVATLKTATIKGQKISSPKHQFTSADSADLSTNSNYDEISLSYEVATDTSTASTFEATDAALGAKVESYVAEGLQGATEQTIPSTGTAVSETSALPVEEAGGDIWIVSKVTAANGTTVSYYVHKVTVAAKLKSDTAITDLKFDSGEAEKTQPTSGLSISETKPTEYLFDYAAEGKKVKIKFTKPDQSTVTYHVGEVNGESQITTALSNPTAGTSDVSVSYNKENNAGTSVWIKVKAQDNTEVYYHLVLKMKAPSDKAVILSGSTLENMNITGDLIGNTSKTSPAELSVKIPGDAELGTSAKLVLKIDDSNAKVKYVVQSKDDNAPNDYSSGTEGTVTPDEGDNITTGTCTITGIEEWTGKVIYIQVTAQDGETVNYYKLPIEPTNIIITTDEKTLNDTDTTGVTIPAGSSVTTAELKNAAGDVALDKQIMDNFLMDTAESLDIDQAEAKELLKTKGIDAGDSPVYVHVVSYLDVNVEKYDDVSSPKSYVLDIKPEYYVAVSTENVQENLEFSDRKQNAAYAVAPQEIANEDLPESIKVTIPLPTNHKLGNDADLYVNHTHGGNKYVYQDEDGQNNKIVFTNPHGFSEFEVTDAFVAKIGKNLYATLQDAVDAAKNGDTITLGSKLEGSDAKAVVKTSKSFKIDAGTTGTDVTITKENGTVVTPDENDWYVIEATGKPADGQTGGTTGGTSGGTTSTHSVKVEPADNGSVTASTTSAAPNTEVTLTVKPAEGYVLDKLTAKTDSGQFDLEKKDDTTYTFKMPAADVTVTATFKLASEQKPEEDAVCAPYTDVDSSYAYHDQVHYMIENNLMTGVAKDTFGLNVVLNRAMVAQILYSKAEPTKPNYTVTKSFSDVKAGDWFANSVTWAETKGVTAGYGDGTFRPYNQVTREELVTMLYGEADQPDVTGNLSAYTDASSVSDWAVKPMTWAIENGVVTGTTATTLSPKNTTPRYQAAIMFYKYFTK